MLTLEQVLIAAAQYYNPEAKDQQEFSTPGTYSFTVPTAVTSISAVAIGGGGGGASNVNDGGGGGGAGLQYRNDIAVTPGETLTVVVGVGGAPGINAATGGASGIYRSGTQLVYATGGTGARSQFGGAGGAASSNGATSIPYSPLGNSSLSSVNGVLSVVTNTNVDDTFYQINLPFTIYFLGVPYTRIFVGSNAYITFSAGSSIYYGYSASQPPGPHVLIYPADRRLFQLYSGRLNTGTSNDKFIIRQHGGDYANPSRVNIWEAHFYPNANYFDIFFITEPGGNYVTPAISNGSTYLASYASTAGTAVRISTVDPSAVGIAGFSGGAGGSGSAAFGGNYLAGGGGGAAGYTAAGGAGGNGNNSIGQGSTGGGGGGGNADDSLARGGGGTGLQGIGNNGAGNGGGGSSYNAITSVSSTASNTGGDLYPVDLSWAWGNFINTYGVWVTARGADDGQPKIVQRGFNAPYSGTYTVQYAADNSMRFSIDGTLVAVTSDFSGSATTTTYMSRGEHVFRFEIQNYGAMSNWYNNPAGFALTIRDSANALIWDTRTYRLMNSGNSLVRVQAGGTAANGQNGGTYGGGGGGRDTDGGSGEGGYGGNGGVRIIWGRGRSYPYQAQDVIPVTIASTQALILHYDAANIASYNGGNTIYDISGNGNHGTISLGYAPATVPTIGSNKVIRFPVSQNTKIDFSANELTASRITVEMWALVDDFASGMFFGWYIHDVWTAGGTLGYNTGQGDVYGIPAARINQLNIRDRWAHYVFVMQAGDYNQNKIYINGVEQSLSQQYSNQYTPYTNFNSGNGRIGGWRLENSYQQVMDLGIFKIYNRQLTQAEITTSYNENLARFSTPIYYTGLWGKRVDGYFNDNVNYFSGRTVVESMAFPDIQSYSSYRDQYSWEWTGYFQAPYDGTYTFGTGSDDASYLWIGSTAVSGYTTGNALINNGGLHGYRSVANSIYLLAGVYYPIRIQFGENYGADAISVSVIGPQFIGIWGNGYFFHDDGNRI
jgi:hypothetical protein